MGTPKTVMLLALIVGCGGGSEGPETGRLEIVIDAPPAAAGSQYVVLQAPPAAENPLDLVWEAEPFTSTPLGSSRTGAHLTMRSEDDTINVHLKVRFCSSEDCAADPMAPAIWFAIEHPFYIGEDTEFTSTVEVPSTPPTDAMCAAACDDYDCGVVESECQITFIDKCRVRGCVEGDPAISYCVTGEETHFCE